MRQHLSITHSSSVALVATSLLLVTSCLDPDEAGNLVPKTVTQDPDLPAIEINGTRLHAEIFGNPNNPILILHHGGPGNDYRALISEVGSPSESRYPDERDVDGKGLSQLQDDYYCLFYSQRGGGLSPRFDPADLNIELLIEDLDHFVDYMIDKKEQETGIIDTQVTLFGWSFGGVLVTGYTNTHPERVKDVITFEHGPLTKKDVDLLIVTSPFAELATTKVDEWLYNAEHISADTHARADFMRYVGANRFPTELHYHPKTPFWRDGAFMGESIDDYGRAIAGTRLVDNLDAFEGRFLYLYGGRTEALTAKGVEQFGSHYPDATIVEIPGTGHSGPYDAADAVADLMRDFMETE